MIFLLDVRTELRYFWYSKSLLIVAALMVGGALVAFSGSVSAATGAHKQFVQEVVTYEDNGVTLESALVAPLRVTTSADGHQEIDNPLKYDYLQVGKSLQAIDGMVPMMGTVLDLVSFIVIPMLFLFLGAHIATNDRRWGMLKLRVARSSWISVTFAKVASIVVVAVMAVATSCVAAFVLSYFGSRQAAELRTQTIMYATVAPESISPAAAKIAMTIGLAVFFGILGYAIGAATNSQSWPMLVAGAALFVLPFQGTWDPRNLLATVGSDIYDFWGQFQMRPPIPVNTAAAAAVLLGITVCALAVSVILPVRCRRYL